MLLYYFFFFSSRRRHTRLQGDWSSDVCSSDLRPHGLSRRAAWWGSSVASGRASCTRPTGSGPKRLESAHNRRPFASIALQNKGLARVTPGQVRCTTASGYLLTVTEVTDGDGNSSKKTSPRV